MNKVTFLTGLLTALLFIGTAHGRQFDRQAFELEELKALMQNSNAEMETVDENEIAKALIQTKAEIMKVGCPAAQRYCLLERTAITQGWIQLPKHCTADHDITFCNTICSILTKAYC